MLTAFADNLIMSFLFLVLWYQRRPKLAGLSYGAAWTKMLGTGCTAIMGFFLFPQIMRNQVDKDERPGWHYVYVIIFALDLVYVLLLWRARRAEASAQRSAPSMASSLAR